MEHCTVDADSIIIKIAHPSSCLEIEDFDCSVFASSEKPLVVLLKLERCDVASVALELCFAICCNSAHCIVGNIVDFDKIVGSDAHVFAVSSQSEFVDLCLG